MSDVAKTPREELECEKKYLYEHSMFWECNDSSKCQILEDDVVRLLNEQQTEIDDLKECTIENIKLKEENKQLRKENDDFHKSIKEYEELRKRLNKDKSRLIEEKMSLNAFVIEKGLIEEYMRWENE